MRRMTVAIALVVVAASAAMLTNLAVASTDISGAVVEQSYDVISSATSSSKSTPTNYYNGKAQEPSIDVTLNGEKLVKDVDYTLSFSNNINAGTATVTATGIGSYSGTATGTFTIVANTLLASDITYPEGNSFVYLGESITPKVNVTSYEMPLTEGVDYTVSYINNTGIGDAMISVKGKGNFSGSVRSFFHITKAQVTLKSLTVKGNKKLKVQWTGSEGIPSYQVYYKAKGPGSFKSVSSKKNSVVLKNLTKGKQTLVYVAAKGTNGKVVAKSATKTSAKIK